MTGLDRDELGNFLFYSEELNRIFRKEIHKIWTNHPDGVDKPSEQKLALLLTSDARDMLLGVSAQGFSNANEKKWLSRAQAIKCVSYGPPVEKTLAKWADRVLTVAAALKLVTYEEIPMGKKRSFAVESTELLDSVLHVVFSEAVGSLKEREVEE